MKKTEKTKDQKRHDNKMIAFAVSRAHSRAFNLLLEFKEDYYMSECDITSISSGIISKIMGTNDFEITRARNRKAQKYVGEQWEEDTTPLSAYADL
jgi:hypothetical protein